MSRLRISPPSPWGLVALWLGLPLIQIVERTLDGERLDLRNLVAAWAVAGAITLVPYGLIRLAIRRRARP